VNRGKLRVVQKERLGAPPKAVTEDRSISSPGAPNPSTGQAVLAALKDTMIDPLVAVDMRGVFVDFNEAYVMLLGYSHEELRRLCYRDVTPENWHEFETAIIDSQVLTRGYSDIYQKEYRRKDGELIAVELRTVLIRDDGGEPAGMWAIVRDVTAQKRAKDKLLESEAMLQAVFQNARDAIGVLTGGTHIFVNPAYASLFGYSSPDELCGTPISGVVCPEARELVAANVAKRSRGEPAPTSYELPGLRKDGTAFIMEVSASTFVLDEQRYTLALLRDITERKRSEAALAKSEEMFSKAFATSPEAAVIVRVQDGTFVDVNEVFLKTTGYTREEVVGKRRDELSIWANAAEFDIFLALLKSTKRVRGFATLFKMKSGELRDGVLSSDSVDIDGVEHSLNFIEDVTERKRADRELREAKADLERRVAERTAQFEIANQELESFSYSVSHDLRAPLRALDGFSRILLDDYAEAIDEEGRLYLHRICDATDKMAHLVDDLLKLARINRAELRFQQVDITAIAKDVIRKLKEQEPGRAVALSVTAGLWAKGDAALIYSVMDNLLGNAWKYTSKQPSANIEVGRCANREQDAFYVRDDGAGFDMTFAGRLFGAFQRLHRESEYPGTGIGLATVHRIVRRHGGDIWAEAEVGKGATFYFTLSSAP
jgi:PAS domain S-box-containing protein